MVIQNSSNQRFQNSLDGFSLGGGSTTRTLTLSGGNLSILLSTLSSGDILQYNGTNFVNVPSSTFGTGSVTSITAGSGLLGGTITNSGTISLNVSNTGGLSIGTSGLGIDFSTLTASTALTPTMQIMMSQDGTSASTTTIGSLSSEIASVLNISGTNTGDQTITLSGDVSGSGTGAITTTLANTGVTAGSYGNGSAYTTFTVDSKGRLTSAGTVSLGDMAFQNSGSVNITGGTINGALITGITMPTGTSASALDAVNRGYVDSLAQGLDAKEAVRVATTADVNLATGGLLTIDGVTLVDGNRVLVKAQVDPEQNGIYIAHSGSWVRASDMDVSGEVPSSYVFVTEGSTFAGHGYVVVGFTSADTINVDPIVWTQFSQAGAYTAGAGLDINTGSFPAVFSLKLSSLTAGTTALGTGDLVAISQGGTTVSTTLGSLSAFIAGASVIGAGAINVTSGTISLVTDAEFVQTGGTLALATSGVTAGTYGDATHPAIITVDSKGRVTSATTGSIALGTGSVTSVSVAGANGIGVSGSPITNSGTISLSLGDITPTSVAATGTVSGSNLSGTNTGDQTITLTGDVTGSGTGSFVTTLATVNANVGTFTAVTVNAKGLVTAATNLAATGDVTGVASGTSINLTLGSVVTAGTYNRVVVNSKGLVTSGTNASTNWVDVTSTSQVMSTNTGYMADNAALVTLTLPTSVNFGDIIQIAGFGAGGWTIAQNAGQVIHFGDTDSTVGVGGSISSTNRYDAIELLCVSNTHFVVRNSVGNMVVA